MGYIAEAADLAAKYHAGQRDKIGQDYFTAHVEPVANFVRNWGGTEYQVTAAYLHDLIEDTPITADWLGERFPQDVVFTVEMLTKPKGRRYSEFIEDIITWQPAVLVKIADITSNMDPARLFYIEPVKRQRLVEKYTAALPVLWQNYQGR